jgi:SAM-dependent methyltransferase
MNNKLDQQWAVYQKRYLEGEMRALILGDIIRADAEKLGKERGKLSLLDIGCGSGFDCDPKLQESLAQMSAEYIGVEPDLDIQLGNFFGSTFRCRYEEAPIKENSIDIAFSVMVLEHFENPRVFWEKTYKILKPGGVFWGFTIDARHWFVSASLLTQKLGIKDWYLNRLHGKRGEGRYENYRVFYLSNTPEQILRLTSSFRSSITLNFTTIGQMDYYYPKGLKWLGRTMDRLTIWMGLPGCLLAVRVTK